MSAETPRYQLPYLEGTDRARDIATISKLLAERIEHVILGLEPGEEPAASFWKGTLPNSTNLDDVTEPGLYGYWGSSPNAPEGVSGLLLVGQVSSNVSQQAFTYGTNPRTRRRYKPSTGSFSAWRPTDQPQDTGFRDIRTLVSDYSVGQVTIRRVGPQVTMILNGLRFSVQKSGTILTLPLGFRPNPQPIPFASSAFWTHGVLSSMQLTGTGPLQVESTNSVPANRSLNATVTYYTGDAWPSTLPGTPA